MANAWGAPCMIYLALLPIAYVVMGLTFSVHFSYKEWRNGEDFTVSELWPFFVRIWIWPAGLIMALEDREIGSIVIIPGSRSAKMLRFLRDDEKDP